MKTKILLTLGFALLTITTLNLTAANAALSPRAAANQIAIVSGVTETSVTPATADAGRILLSPRAAHAQIIAPAPATVATVKCTAHGSPKYLAAAGDSARISCCGLTLAQCPSMTACVKN
jgi:hypothetical protein